MRALRFSIVWVAASLPLAATALADTTERCASTAERAQDERDDGAFLAAFRDFEQCSAEECPAIVRSDCRRALLDLRSKAPRVFVQARAGDGSKLDGASVFVDGAPVGSDGLLHGTFVDVGPHRIRVEKSGVSTERTVTVTAADHELTVDVVVTPPLAAPVGAPQGRDRTAAFVVGGVGLALFAAWGVVGAWTLADYQRLKSCDACADSEVDSAETRGVVADVLLGAGIATAIVFTVLWFTAPSRSTGRPSALLSW